MMEERRMDMGGCMGEEVKEWTPMNVEIFIMIRTIPWLARRRDTRSTTFGCRKF